MSPVLSLQLTEALNAAVFVRDMADLMEKYILLTSVFHVLYAACAFCLDSLVLRFGFSDPRMSPTGKLFSMRIVASTCP